MHQVQATATKAIPQVMGAEQFVFVTEVGYTYLKLPGGLEFEGYGTLLPVLQSSANIASGGSVQPGGFATKKSWGYRMVARLDYPNAIRGVNISPRIAFSHDVEGVGPNFNKGALALTFGVGFSFQQNWQADLSYTSFQGGRTFCGTDVAALSAATLAAGQSLDWCTSANSLKDRDFISFNISYSF
jgi:opacity protein-like surface antigen